MLKGLNPLLTPDVLYALCAMGHGDEVVIVDAHYPADMAARSSVYGKLLRMDGVAVPEAIRAALSEQIPAVKAPDGVVSGCLRWPKNPLTSLEDFSKATIAHDSTTTYTGTPPVQGDRIWIRNLEQQRL